jgi:ATP-dependent Clp protease ATP-binding subunit ClpC
LKIFFDMNFSQLKKELQYFYPVCLLEKIISHNTRSIILRVLSVLLVVLFTLASGLFVEPTKALTGLFFLVLIIFIKLLALESLYFSHIFSSKNIDSLYELSEVVYSTNESDLTKGFMESRAGYNALLRAGCDDDSLALFLSQRKTCLSSEVVIFKDSPSKVRSYIHALVSEDVEFQAFLNLQQVTEETLLKSFSWSSELFQISLNRERYWSQSFLEKMSPIGRDWSYGEAYFLNRFSSPLLVTFEEQEELHHEAILTLEISLSKSSQSNVLIVGEEGAGKIEIIEGLARKIHNNRSNPALHKKKFRVLHVDSLLAKYNLAGSLEKALLSICNEIVSAGNLVLVIPNLSVLLRGGATLGVDVAALLIPFMRSPEMHLVGISDLESFHSELSKNNDLMQFMEPLLVSGENSNTVMAVLLEDVRNLEKKQGVFFTYPSVQTAIRSSEYYFLGAPLYDTASDLLLEAIGNAALSNLKVVTTEDVLAVVKMKTGVEAGTITDTERDRLIHLEDLLHTRVVGQDPAIKLVSDAFRRARSGINSSNRPLGSFLFFGPTGVGKTETAKALTEIFFGEKGVMNRLDMSEYNTTDSVNRLIGGYDGDHSGVLATMLRDNPYGVLLLDEFEKTNPDVLDLFLQILDEGIFSDAQGKKVNARNIIIIATSNAGSQIIFDTVSKGEDLLSKKDEIVDRIISEGIFRPEFVNRFDGVVLFEPLNKEQLRKVASIMLSKLVWRLKEKGITLVINDSLLNFLVKNGNDPKFGARPLKRAIQDSVEKIIAEGIISLKYRAGSTVALTDADLSA